MLDGFEQYARENAKLAQLPGILEALAAARRDLQARLEDAESQAFVK